MTHSPFFFILTTSSLFMLAVEGSERSNTKQFFDHSILEMPQILEIHFTELEEKCISLVLQKLVYQRMQSANLIAQSEDAWLLSEIDTIKSEGFTEEEFERVKLQLLDYLDCSSSSPIGTLPMHNACRIIIEKMQCTDLSSHVTALEIPKELRISYLGTPRKNYTQYPERDWMFDTATERVPIRLADNSFRDMNAFLIDSSSNIELFYQLSLDDREKKLIHELIKTIAEKNIWGLLFKKKEMEKLGKRVNQVHPMRFMAHILSDPKLKKWLRDIRHSSFKWDHFIDGFSDRMKEEGAKNNLLPYVPGMAHLLHADPNQLFDFIRDKDYEGLVKSLL